MPAFPRVQQPSPRIGLGVLLVAITCAPLSDAAAASAATVTVGSPLSARLESDLPCGVQGGCASALLKLAEPGAHAASPQAGAIVRWRVEGSSSAAGYTLSVLRSNGAGSYTVSSSSAPVASAGQAVETFGSDLPIREGEFIALSRPYKAAVAALESPSSEAFFVPPLAIGQTRLEEEGGNFPFELGFNADVQPAPMIKSISPALGPLQGGTQVTISGSDLEGANAVRFGDAPASSFTVISENAITAVSPSATAGTVDTTVATVAGESAVNPADHFTYTAPAPAASCVVPMLKGKSLKVARERLRQSSCKLGQVSGKRSKAAKVRTQSARAGTVLGAGYKVSVKLAR